MIIIYKLLTVLFILSVERAAIYSTHENQIIINLGMMYALVRFHFHQAE